MSALLDNGITATRDDWVLPGEGITIIRCRALWANGASCGVTPGPIHCFGRYRYSEHWSEGLSGSVSFMAQQTKPPAQLNRPVFCFSCFRFMPNYRMSA